jgi:alkanesulfonate monooxygenase SsuD/methylene tetrahydromethanopterin reductase-like flavin-dependent oxidoreductase (luciferase family)
MVDIGVFLPTVAGVGEQPGDPASTARHAEDLGFESVWVVDQLIAGNGGGLVDSTVALGAAAGATRRVKLGFGVLIVPLHPLVWTAKQIASLQHVSGGRVLLGVGVGGERHSRSWAAAGVPRQARGRRLDAALALLPDLIAGKPTVVVPGDEPVQLAPPAVVPPVYVGGAVDAALDRAVAQGGWFGLPLPPTAVAETTARLAARAARADRPAPAATVGMIAAIDGDASLPDDGELARTLTDPDGKYGMPADAVGEMLVRGGPDRIAGRMAELIDARAIRIVVDIPGGDWFRQAELLADAVALLG